MSLHRADHRFEQRVDHRADHGADSAVDPYAARSTPPRASGWPSGPGISMESLAIGAHESAADPVDAYFECITTCSLDDGECVTTCTDILRQNS